MKRRIHPIIFAALSSLVACATQRAAPIESRTETALDRYVAAPDASYAWKLADSTRIEGATVFRVDMTSQSWLEPNEVDRTLWRHWLVVVRPDEVAHTTALLFISGGENTEEKPPRAKKDLIAIARATRSVVAELRMVPNQPLVFGGDGVARDEDDLVAYTWEKFLRTGDDRWPARLPMTKAAVRAMDTISAFCGSTDGGEIDVGTFVVAGASKRGWTTWTTAAVDKRVIAICPMVIDVLNMQPSMLHHFQAYGFWAPAVGQYVAHGVMDWLGTPEMKDLLAIEEPYEYRDRLTLPKLMLNAAGDQFFAPDSAQFYFDDLPGVKALRYVPNSDHSLKNTDAMETLLAWHHVMIAKQPVPRFHWTRDDDGAIRVHAIDTPREVKLWQAHNPSARDFRQETLGAVWRVTDLSATSGGEYVGRADVPTQGWTASFVELTYDVGATTPLKLTTDVRVRPDTLPFDPPKTRRPSASTIETSGSAAR